jgi:hypothetical protein
MEEYAIVSVPTSIRVAKPGHATKASGATSFSDRVGLGRSFLKVVAYPWGVEFDVFEAEGEA